MFWAESICGHASDTSRCNVQSGECGSTDLLLEPGPEEVQGVHVESDMHQAGMQKCRAEYAVPVALFDEKVRLCERSEEPLVSLGRKASRDINGNGDADDREGHR